MQCIRSLRPPPILGPDGVFKPVYTLKMLDNELCSMAMLHALPREDYAPFISSVLMLNNLTNDAVEEAFQTEEVQRSMAEEEAVAAAQILKCYLCDGKYKITDCPVLQSARSHVKRDDGDLKPKKRGGHHGGNTAAMATETPKVEEGCDGPAAKAEAAVCRSSLSANSLSNLLWNTDLSTTSSMMPHHEWFIPESFKLWRVPNYFVNGFTVIWRGRD